MLNDACLRERLLGSAIPISLITERRARGRGASPMSTGWSTSWTTRTL